MVTVPVLSESSGGFSCVGFCGLHTSQTKDRAENKVTFLNNVTENPSPWNPSTFQH